ncbi:glycosyltransferase [Jannaschia sp. R86511]|uniref:glycosyltransferase n=1 Tax=Jannaschia sp. R86511 TaxID=3093853 RepID=UPI0036D32614
MRSLLRRAWSVVPQPVRLALYRARQGGGARRPGLAVRRSDAARRRAGFVASLGRQTLPEVPPAHPHVTAAVAAQEWLLVGLRSEWSQQPLGPGWAQDVTDGQAPRPDLVLLQWVEGAVPGLTDDQVEDVLATAEQLGTKVVLWATGSTAAPWPAAHPAARADVVLADDAGTATAWTAAAGRPVDHLPPGASPLVHSPARSNGLGHRRKAVAALVPGSEALLPFAAVPPGHVDVWLAGPDVPLPPTALEREAADAGTDAHGAVEAIGAVADQAASDASDGTDSPDTAAGPDSPEGSLAPGGSAAPVVSEADRQAEARRATAERLAAMRSSSVMPLGLREPFRTLGHYRVATAVGGAPGSSWPLVEASMAGTPLVLDEASMALLPPDLAPLHTLATDADEVGFDTAARLWQRELADREGLVAARAARAGHTLGHRVDSILEATTGHRPVRDRSVSVVVPTNRAHELPTVADNLARQHETTLGNVELVLVLHGLDVDDDTVRAMFAETGLSQLVVLRADASLTLGACLNLGVEAASGRWIAKLDDDNYYGRHYLTDLLDAFGYSGAQVVGKWAHYVWLRSSGAVILRSASSQYRDERLVQGGSIIVDGDLLRRLRFSDIPRAVDTDLLNRVRDEGARTFSADRFNFVSIRGVDRFAHTWPIAETALMNRAGDLVFFGDPRAHVDV